MHNSWDENYQRGYEWWLMTEAKKVQLLKGTCNSGLAQGTKVYYHSLISKIVCSAKTYTYCDHSKYNEVRFMQVHAVKMLMYYICST